MCLDVSFYCKCDNRGSTLTPASFLSYYGSLTFDSSNNIMPEMQLPDFCIREGYECNPRG